MKLILLRHPPIDVAPDICYGASDLPSMAAWRAIDIPRGARILTSPLRRCREFASTLGEAHIDARLREMDFGEWEMRSFTDIGRVAIGAWAADPLHFRPPGGESVADMRERVRAALRDALQAQHAATVIVSHGGPMRVMAGELLDLSPAAWMKLAFPHAEPCVFEHRAGEWHAPSRLTQQLQWRPRDPSPRP